MEGARLRQSEQVRDDRSSVWVFPWVWMVFFNTSAWISYQGFRVKGVTRSRTVKAQSCINATEISCFSALQVLCFAWSLILCFESKMLPQISKTWSNWICYYLSIQDKMVLSNNENINNSLNHGETFFLCRYCFGNRSLYEQHQSGSLHKWITYSLTGSQCWRLMLINTTFNIKCDFWK